jgi:hypothetical protein
MLAHSTKTSRSRIATLGLRTLAVLLPVLAACSHASKKTTPELAQMEGKKVALIEVIGENTARQAVEVALINQLTARGTFILVSKQDVGAARIQFQQDPSDWKGIAKRAGADYALKARVLEFTSNENVGYSRETVEDSQMEAETGEGKTERLYKVKALTGSVRVELQFANLGNGDTRIGVAEKQGKAEADERTGAAHLPPRLSFLTGLLEQAFRQFFDQNQ